jgi:hypothetical protein
LNEFVPAPKLGTVAGGFAAAVEAAEGAAPNDPKENPEGAIAAGVVVAAAAAAGI